MEEIKRCAKCGVIISILAEADYYSHIRKKYCSECASDMNRENARERAKRIRRITKENNKLSRELNNRLLQENELLRKRLEETREIIEDLRNDRD